MELTLLARVVQQLQFGTKECVEERERERERELGGMGMGMVCFVYDRLIIITQQNCNYTTQMKAKKQNQLQKKTLEKH